jgi:DNA polymerase-4
MQQSLIAHFDLDSFFVSAELLEKPSLRGQPLIVGGSRERGVVTTCSYEARAFGVQSAMPMAKALRLCPQAVVLPVTPGLYNQYSKWVTDIIADAAPSFEKASIDEFYVDLTGMEKYFDPLQWTINLREKITSLTGLPISFGLSANRLVSKIATSEAKPNGYLFIPPGYEIDFLAPLPVEKIPGVGGHTLKLLQKAGIRLVEDVQQKNIETLQQILGKWGADLWHASFGKRHSVVKQIRNAKSISTENTFMEYLTDEKELLRQVSRMTEKVAYELRAGRKMAGCIAVKIRYPDFKTVSKQRIINPSIRDNELIPAATKLFRELYNGKQPVRLMGIRLSYFSDILTEGNLFEDIPNRNNLYLVMDEVKNRFGKKILRNASSGK